MNKEDKAGIHLTIIVHLVVLIVLLALGIGSQLKEENTFVLDFTREEELEKQQKEEEIRRSMEDRVEDMVAAARSEGSRVKNVAVSRNLSDDRHSKAETDKLYADAARLAGDLKAGYKPGVEEDARQETVDIDKLSGKDKERQQMQYSGPSVLSWTLEGRKASHLPIPAYRCYGAGEVTVAISVDQQGKVQTAHIVDNVSTGDECLRAFALKAARLSRFNRDTSAPLRQAGTITYAFIAQ